MGYVVILLAFYGLPFLGTVLGFLLCDRIRGKQVRYWISGLIGSAIGTALLAFITVSALQDLTRGEFLENSESAFNALFEISRIWLLGTGIAALLGLLKPLKAAVD